MNDRMPKSTQRKPPIQKAAKSAVRKVSEVAALQARVKELESIAHGRGAMLDYIAQAAGYGPGDTFTAEALVKKMRTGQ
jgi:hypothetical protein